jgi:pyruvate carboxylase subunit B
MISQVALSITHSPVHTVDYYMGVVDKVVEYGCDEICLKDMAGVGRPSFLAELTARIKKKYPHILVQYHGHSGPGFSPASMLEVARAGADFLDVAVEPLSWGKVHPDVITVREMLRADGFQVKDLNMDAYMEVRSLNQRFIDEFLGYWIDPNNAQMSSLLVGCGLPGGMMGSMMADLKGFHGAINASLRAQGKQELTLDRLMVMLFQEVEYVWPRLGYPPLVTPFSQYVKNTALMNLLALLKGQPRWGSLDKDTWNMILGKMGSLPGELDPEIVALAESKGLEFYSGVPQDAFPDELEKFRSAMVQEGWDFGPDDEELFEFAMHERQYRDYKSGVAKSRFEADLEAARLRSAVPVQAPVKGQLVWQVDVDDVSCAPVLGSIVKAGEPMAFIQTYYGLEEVVPAVSGRIVSVSAKHGDSVSKSQILAHIKQ